MSIIDSKISVSFALVLTGLLACGDDTSTGGTGGKGGNGGMGGEGVTVTSGPSSTTGGDPMCDTATLWPAECGSCLEQNCCLEVSDFLTEMDQGTFETVTTCAGESSCAGCFATLTGLDADCSATIDLTVPGACGDIVGSCNPVTNEGCDAGDACDFSFGGFACYAGDNTRNVCATCDLQMNFCQPGATCYEGTGAALKCARYCCDTSDCGGGTCTKTIDGNPIFGYAPGVGICDESGAGGAGGAGGGGGAGGAGGGGGLGGAGGLGVGGGLPSVSASSAGGN